MVDEGVNLAVSGVDLALQDSLVELSQYKGVGITNADSDLTASGTTFAGNGQIGLYVESADTVDVSDCTFSENSKGLQVSAVASMRVAGDTFTGNTWGVYQTSATVWDLTDNTFTENTYPIYQGNSDLNYSGNSITGNTYQAIVVGSTRRPTSKTRTPASSAARIISI